MTPPESPAGAPPPPGNEEVATPIVPRPDQLAALGSAPTGPVVMVNLLRFKATAGEEEETGAQAYQRYAVEAIRLVTASGGRLLWSGRVDGVVIGDDEADGWDAVALAEYPSRAAFLAMVASAEYQDAHRYREAGLADTVLLACTSLAGEA